MFFITFIMTFILAWTPPFMGALAPPLAVVIPNLPELSELPGLADIQIYSKLVQICFRWGGGRGPLWEHFRNTLYIYFIRIY